MSSATDPPPPYLFLDFQFPAQELSGSLPYKDVRYIESRGIQLIHAKRLTHTSGPNTQSCVKPGFHIIVRVVPVAPVFSNYVQATGTIIWKHHRDDRGRSKKTEKTGTIAIAWIEKFLSGRPKRSRKIVNVLMKTTFGRPGQPKRP